MVRIEVPFLPPIEYSPNSREFWAQKHKAGKVYHDAVFYCCVDARNRGYREGLSFPFVKAKLNLTVVFAELRLRDVDNLLARFKPGLDAVVDSGLILDDDVEHLQLSPDVIIVVDPERAPLTIIELAEIKKLEGQKMVTAFDTWKCHICGEERPDDKISVLTKPLIINGQACGDQNIRYCNDRPTCIDGAKEFSFSKE